MSNATNNPVATMRPFDPAHLRDVWVDVLWRLLVDELGGALPGHCLRVSDLPRSLLTALTERLIAERPPGTEVYFVDRPAGPEPWRVGVHKVVERRNEEESVLLALFPPDLLLAAGDSVDVSTFRTVPTGDVASWVEEDIAGRIPAELRLWAYRVLDDLRRRAWPVTPAARLTYLATIAAQDSDDPAIVGAALHALGLLPDFRLLENPEELHYRLGQRNIPVVQRLCDLAATPLERVLRLPFSDDAFQARLMAFFAGRRPEEVSSWGAVVATDPAWRDLALDQWPTFGEAPPAGQLRIDIEPLKLPRRKDDGFPFLETPNKVSVAWQTAPPPIDVPGLTYFRVEVLNSDRVVTWESPLIKAGGGKTARRSRTIKGLVGLDNGIYFFRIIALNAIGDPFPEQGLRDETGAAGNIDGKRTNESEDFLLIGSDMEEIGEVESPTSSGVRNYAHAELLTRWAMVMGGKDPNSGRAPAVAWVTPLDARGDVAVAGLQFSVQHQYTVRLSQRLRALELAILNAPDGGGHHRLRLDVAKAGELIPLQLPSDMAQARRAVFDAIRHSSMTDEGKPVVALVDLCALASKIEHYAETYRAWLGARDPDALRLDITLTEIPEYGGVTVALMSPTHPLRLLWALQEQQLARTWSHEAWQRHDTNKRIVDVWRESFAPQGLPLALVLDDASYLDAGPLVGGWGAYLSPRLKDSRTVLAAVRAHLGSGSAHRSDADAPPGLLTSKLESFVHQHPYTAVLVINVINPGDASLVVDALIELERCRARDRDLPPIRYSVRLFTDGQQGEVGQAFRDLIDPDAHLSEAAAQLAGPGRSFLFPKLSWSRNALADFLRAPERFAAHVTLVLDAFPVELRVAHADRDDRTSFVYGLVQDALRRFKGGTRAYAWRRQPAPAACHDLPDAPGRSQLLAAILGEIGALQARLLAPNTDTTGSVAVVELALERKDQLLLYSAHAVSTWVLTLDAHLGLDYFDSARRADRPGYLLDFTPEFVATGGRQLLLTTRIDTEVARLMDPAAMQIDLDGETRGAQLLLETLRSLSGRLALRLLSAPSQVQGALGMALSKLFLDAYALLDEAIVIPLDAHQELTAHDDPEAPRLRGDLLVVQVNPATQLVDFLLVETKCYGGVGLSADLRAEIAAQLDSSDQSLRAAFDPAWAQPDRIDRDVQNWRLANVLNFYLDRAVRYQLISDSLANSLRRFFANLDAGYTLQVRKIGLVFRLDAADTTLDRTDPELPIWIVGRDEIDRIVGAALQQFAAREERDTESDALAPSTPQRATMSDDHTWHDVRRTFTLPGVGRDDKPPQEDRGTTPVEERHELEGDVVVLHAASPEPPVVAQEPSIVTVPNGVSFDSLLLEDDSPASAVPEYAVMLGEAGPTPQFGLFGTVAAESWRRVAFDLDGCNTVSIFGVQGGGKSYTVGAIVEMAVQPLAGLNLLPEPLGAVVFHYHQTQDYPPEFVSMHEANDAPSQVQALADWGAVPTAVRDMLVLTTADTVDLRRKEFPYAVVEPIAFSSAELTVTDWRFLMGATGSDALYLKLLNEVMRKSRDELTLEVIRAGLATVPLSDNQRGLAETRLEFAARFIDDARSLRSLLKPGRLLIVDLRDEFIEKEQALGLFVTMLNVFAGAGLDKESGRFNKLIVFDEAHKYMGGALIGQVVELIREMRHKGVTVAIASQDPINVPPAIIELSSSVVLHRFNSPNWLRHIQKSLSPLADLTPAMLSSLAPGEAFVWANKASDPTFTRRTVKVRIRPRATKHGGSTQTAVDG